MERKKSHREHVFDWKKIFFFSPKIGFQPIIQQIIEYVSFKFILNTS